MPTIRHEITIARPIADVWDAVADVGALHSRVVPGFVTATEMLADAPTPTRRVTFASGVILDERIVSVDAARHRLVWSIASVEHHNGAMELQTAEGGTRVSWTADVLPEVLADQFSPLMAEGLRVMKAHFER